jgi:DNA-binding transcriptional LysR family regulator
MNLKQLEAFVEITDTGSFSKAAKKLAVTQPTISSHISMLEKELKVKLFVRSTKEIKLSKDGEVLYQYAKNMVEIEKKIFEIFLPKEDEENKCINIVASTIPAQYLLPDILSQYMKKYPKRSFKILETDSKKVSDQISEYMSDVGFAGTIVDKINCKYLPIYQDELVIAMPNQEKYQKIKEQSPSLDWIVREPMIVREEGSGTRKEAERRMQNEGIDIEELNIVASIESPEVIKRSVKRGVGITIISKLAIQKEVEMGEILEMPLSTRKNKRDLYLVYNKNKQPSKAVDDFIKVVKSVYDK